MDKRVLAIGVAMLVSGLATWAYFNNTEPAGKPNMTDEETSQFYQDLAVSVGLKNIASMIAGIGFFIALISIGLKRRNKGGVGKSITQKPTQS